MDHGSSPTTTTTPGQRGSPVTGSGSVSPGLAKLPTDRASAATCRPMDFMATRVLRPACLAPAAMAAALPSLLARVTRMPRSASASR